MGISEGPCYLSPRTILDPTSKCFIQNDLLSLYNFISLYRGHRKLPIVKTGCLMLMNSHVFNQLLAPSFPRLGRSPIPQVPRYKNPAFDSFSRKKKWVQTADRVIIYVKKCPICDDLSG